MEDEYVVEEYSEDDYDSSSSEDDDIQAFIKKEYGLLEVEDDFEAEVDKVMTAHLQKLKPPESEAQLAISASTSAKSADALKQEKINDELLYDPNMDEEDEKWVNEKRRSYIFPSPDGSSNATQKPKPLPNSDAVLNCPACLCLLCLDCQRHDIYKSQYRAMFVSNCTIVESETLKYPKKKKKFRKKTDDNKSDEYELFNPVRCSVCNTEVAVYDAEEMYHFFNVLASY